MCKILIVEDDRQTNLAICEYLCSIGYTTLSAFDGSEALSIFSQNTIDLIILDIMLPKKSGLDVLHQIRDSSLVPILMLTAIQDECTQINSFDLQADDYIVKPFSMILLGKLTVGNNVVVDFDGYTAVGESGKIDITPKEIDLLRLLIEHKGLVLTRSQILDNLWGLDASILDRTIDTYIKNLRKKLKTDNIITVKGIGYKYEADK